MTSASQGSQSSETTPVAKNTGNHQRRKYQGTMQLTSGSWGAVIQDPHKHKAVWLGTFDTEEDAAIAFDVAALRFRGSSSELNFPKCTENRPSKKGNKTSKNYRGVRQTPSGRWQARTRDPTKHKEVHLGSFNTAEDAALAYDEAALKFQGRRARFNFPDRFPTRTEAPELEKQLDQTLQAGNGQGGRKDVEDFLIKAEQSDKASKQIVEGSTKIVGNEGVILPFEKKKTLLGSTMESMEEIVFSVEVVREHIALREKLKKLQEQFEEVKGEIAKRITEKAEIEEHFEAMKEAKDHQIASLTLKRIVLEEDMADVELDVQTSVASLGITAGVNLDIGSISREPTRRKVGLKACSNIKRNNQVLSTEVTSQVDSSPILEKNGDNLVSEKYETNDRREFVSATKDMAIHKDLDAEKNPVGQLFSSGPYGSVTRNIEELLSQRKKLSKGLRSLSLMGKLPKREVSKSDPTIHLEDENDSHERGTIIQSVKAEEEILKSDPPIPEIIHLEDENESPGRLAIVQSVKEETAIIHSLSKDKLSGTIVSIDLETIQSPEADDKCTPVHFVSSEEKSSRPSPFIYLEEEDQYAEQIEQLEVLTNESGKLDSLVSGGQLEIKSGEEVHKKKGVLGGCVLSGNNGVEGSEKPSYSEGDEQLQMKNAGEEVQKRKGGRPRKFDGFVLPSNVSRKRKKGTVLESDAEYSLPKSQKRTKKEKDVQEELVGFRIKVWWPADQQYYEGIVESYDPAKKKHRVAYFDGDIENLILKKERWLEVDEKSDSQRDQVVPSASAMPADEPEIESKSNKDQEHEKAV